MSKWTPDEDERLRQLVKDGASNGQAAKALGRPRSTTHDRAKRLGLSFDRSQPRKAVESHVQDARARRAALALKELEIIERSAQLHLDGLDGNGWRTLIRGEGGSEHSTTLDFIPAKDASLAAQARNTSASIIARLDDRATEHDTAKSVVAQLFDQLEVVVKTADEDTGESRDAD